MDKILKRYIFITILLIFIMTFSYAITIDEQIEAIKNAPEPKRVELMNQFKRQLVLMNQKQREKAINRLRYSINGKREVNDNSVSSIHSNLINNIESSNIEQNTQIINHHILQQEINNFAQADREPEPITEPTTPTVPQTPVEPEPTTEPTTPTVPETPVEPEPTTEPTTQPESSSSIEQQSDTTIESSSPKEDEQLEHNSNVSPSRGRSR